MELSISETLRACLRRAESVFVLTGAGVSAESGVPTFRGGGGAMVWKGMPFDVISSAGMVERDLASVWEWFDYRRALLRDLQPNAAHHTLARWQDRFEDFTLVTQNIDGLHAAAGSHEPLELHGNIHRARCVACDARASLTEIDAQQEARVCRACGAALRPDVVLFGEMLPPEVFRRATERAATCDLCFVVGTSAIVYPAAQLPLVARRAGAYLVEINPEPTPLSGLCDETLAGRAGEILPFLDT